jgi:hypothetical protein
MGVLGEVEICIGLASVIEYAVVPQQNLTWSTNAAEAPLGSPDTDTTVPDSVVPARIVPVTLNNR